VLHTYLDGQPVLQVKETSLTDILQLGAGLADFRLLEAHLGPGTPAEDGEGTGADLALLAVLLLGHPQVGVITQARLAEDGEVRVFPVLPIVGVGSHACRHDAKVVLSLKW
jgi:hypothetical protein